MAVPGRLPDFLVIGAPKAGTTALYRALSRHPHIFCPQEKEPRFFAYVGTRPRWSNPGGAANAARIATNEADYLQLFAGCAPGRIAGEASCEYLSSPQAAKTAFRYVPRARLIAVLRHPVERGYSQWLHLRQEGKEPLANFEAAWNAEEERMARGSWPLWQYRYRGLYGHHLERWVEFFPRNQLLVLFYEDWLERPFDTLSSVFQHLGVDAMQAPRVTRENWSSRQPRWPWLHHRMVGDNALRRWAQRRLPLPVRDAITKVVTDINLKPGPILERGLRARLAKAFHEDLGRVEKLTQKNLDAWRS